MFLYDELIVGFDLIVLIVVEDFICFVYMKGEEVLGTSEKVVLYVVVIY